MNQNDKSYKEGISQDNTLKQDVSSDLLNGYDPMAEIRALENSAASFNEAGIGKKVKNSWKMKI